MFVVFQEFEDAMGFDTEEMGRFATETEAQAYVTELEKEEIQEYGEVVNYYSYYDEEDC